MKKFQILVILFLLGIFHLLIIAKPLPNKISPSKQKIHSEEYYDNLLKEGMKIDNLTQGHPPYYFDKKMDYKAEKKRRKEIIKDFIKSQKLRKLSTEEQTLEKLGFFGLIQNGSSTQQNRVMKFVVNRVKKDDSRFILYPYPFKYTEKKGETSEEINVNEGGVFTLNQSALTNVKFSFIQNISSVNIAKAKSIYDIDIAILSYVKHVNGVKQDVFREAPTFCAYFKDGIEKISSCLEGKSAYDEYKQNNPNKGAVVRVSYDDLKNGILYSGHTLKFKLLIIPDYITNNEETIDNAFNPDAVAYIKKFRKYGGHIIATGKSGYLLELWGLIEEGTYDSQTTLHSSEELGEHSIYGCQDIYKSSPDEQSDFLKQLICLGYRNYTVLSSTFVVNKIPEHFESLVYYTNHGKSLYTKKNGQQFDDKNRESTYHYIMVSKQDDEENKGKGVIFLVNGNPIENTYYIANVRNMILYSMTRDVIYDLKIKFNKRDESSDDDDEDLPIPGGEQGVQLIASYQFFNLFDTPIKNFKLEILFAKKIEIKNVEKLNEIGCQLKTDDPTKYNDLNENFIIEKYLLCTKDSIDVLNSIRNEFLIEITDNSITQQLIDIPLMYSSLSYSITENNEDKTIEITPGIYYAQAALAAVLRGTLNKDPSSTYPLYGKGLYFDLVLTVENKENTKAKDVNYISFIPLISPLVDGEDEGLIARLIPIHEEYYTHHNYIYPWTDTQNRGSDYIDYAELAGKGVCYVEDFDTPVKLTTNLRSNINDITNKFDPQSSVTLDENAGTAKGISQNTLLKQVYFGDSEKFYETAAPRKTVFIDTTTEKGAEAYYGNTNNIPEDEKDKGNPNIARAHLGFVRIDTFFYSSKFNQYQLPKGFNEKILISLDKYDQSTASKDGTIFGEKKAEIYKEGHYDSTKNKYNTLKPNEYTNPLRQYEFLKKYDPTKPEELKALQDLTSDTLKLTHFMFPNKDTKITRAGNIYGFHEDIDGKSGYLIEYPSVKFIYAHSIDLILDPEITHLGGCVEIILPTTHNFKDSKPVENDRIIISADNVAFFKTEYFQNNNSIKLYFRRGLMPNENSGFPSKCGVYLEELDNTDNFEVTVKLYELKYDFSKESLEDYILIEDVYKNKVNAEYKSFYFFPCVYIENTLSRKSEFSDELSNEMFEYELVNPFARYGGYFQELTKHTTVYGNKESHHVKDPGFQGLGGGFSLIHNVGTSSIPFAEFLNHGTLMIPGAISTSRIQWKDIWGRFWAQSLRSIYPDIPPVPPAPLSFIMTTTFELIDEEHQKRVLEWQSDEPFFIRVQMKMRNTYNKYWEPTICKENQISFFKTSNKDYRNPSFLADSDLLEPSETDNNDINLGFTPNYGKCYNEKSYVSGQKLTSEKVALIQQMETCSDTSDPLTLTQCSNEATAEGLPQIKRKPEGSDAEEKKWNYSPLIEDYYPKYYITNQMWDLTGDGYYDDPLYKGFPFHLDDCIPNLDNHILKPHDMIAFPIFKGLGYSITYDNNYCIDKFDEYKGWWSDQLQNNDHTLIAGQRKVREVSVGDHESILEGDPWIDAFNLKQNEATKNVIDNRLKNLYVCMFNRHRVKIKPGQEKYAFLKNVYQNNVIPLLPNLEEDDNSYTQYECDKNIEQYTPKTISEVDNRVNTGTDRDWLYFAAGLRIMQWKILMLY